MIEKLQWHVGRPLYAAWHWAVRSRFYDPSRTVLVSASPRSGSTWVAEVLARASHASLIWEPLSRKHGAAQAAGFRWNTYLRPGETDEQKRDYIEGILSGRTLRPEMVSFPHFRLRHFLTARRLLVKCVRASCLLPWLAEWVPGPVVYLIRHPCAVVASQLRHPDFGPLITAENVAFPEKVGREFPHLQRIRDRIETTPEAIALEWVVQNALALRGRDAYTAVVSYEQLVSDPAGEFGRTLKALGVQADRVDDLTQEARRESSTVQAGRSAAQDVQDLSRWHDELDDRQTDTILELVERCGIEGFTRDPVPALKAVATNLTKRTT